MDDKMGSSIIEVDGIVQGVGFRPFVYQLARCRGLNGEVANTSNGVVIRLEGPCEEIELFLNELEEKPPPLAYVVKVRVREAPYSGFADFSIAPSRKNEKRSTLISPDMSVCDDCLEELFDPGDRRFEYPFINCTNCGPRYTIIEDIPYDRPKTSMRHFAMCGLCRKEYDDPRDRRFHAQPNACPECGPRVVLLDSHGEKAACDNPVEKAAQLLCAGKILALKGLGGFHLAADAENDRAVAMLRQRKHREEKPLALMALDMETVRLFADPTDDDERLLKSARRPIVVVEKKTSSRIAEQVAPGNGNFGVMLPYTPLHYLILSKFGGPLVMTSGNLSEEPICIENEDAFARLSDIADFFLVHDRDIYLRSDDSIVRGMGGQARFYRRSRGYVPMPVFLRRTFPPVLACGGELKNTVCLIKGDKAFLSQHVGDLENLATLDFFRMTIDHMKRIIDVEPEVIACDMHPDYLSTRYAMEQDDLPVIPVRHHHAHIVSCLAENKRTGPVIGLAFDGTGYGADGTVWGGEVLIADEKKFERAGHLDPVAMPGAAAAIREPFRMALSYLRHVHGENVYDIGIPFLEKSDPGKARIIFEMIEKKINSPQTSSLGRLFDGVAALLGLRDRAAFEGQAAMELETAAKGLSSECYDFLWECGSARIVSLVPIIEGVVEDLRRGEDVGEISGKFHSTLVRGFSRMCVEIREETGIDTVALSGGAFQNKLLFEGLLRQLQGAGFEVLTHRLAPCNDGGLALGQAVSAAARI